MATIATVVLLLVHGLIHIFGVRRLPKAARAPTTLWFFAGSLFLGAAVLCAVRSDIWPIVAGIGVFVSQALVVVSWREAKSATFVNALVAAVALVAGATAHLHASADADKRELLALTDMGERSVSAEDLAGLPEPVRRWLERAGVVGQRPASVVRIEQRGELHASNDSAWMPIEADEYLTTTEPGFVWWVEGRMARVLPLAGRDELVRGHGVTDITIGGLVPVASDRGPKLDQAALVRWLAEIMWIPSAALEPYVQWEPMDRDHARATVVSHENTAAATFEFDADGRVTAVTADRWYASTEAFERWGGQCSDWRRFRGVEIPVVGEVHWYLKTGDFTFFRWRIVDAVAEPARPPVDPARLGWLASDPE